MNRHQRRANAKLQRAANDGSTAVAPGRAMPGNDKAVDANISAANAHVLRGDSLRDLNRPEKALASYDRAVAISPSNALAHDRRGLVLVELGRLAEARSAHEKAVSLAPRKASFIYNLTAVMKLKLDSPIAQAMQGLLRDIASLEWEEQTTLHFALGKMFADNEDYKRSFQHFLAYTNKTHFRAQYYNDPYDVETSKTRCEVDRGRRRCGSTR